jgi:WD40 repeat protein
MRVLGEETKQPRSLLAFGPSGLLAAGCGDLGLTGDFEIWDVTTGLLQRTCSTPAYAIQSLAFTQDGRSLLVSAEDALRAFDPQTGVSQVDPLLRVDYAECSLSADGRRLLVAETQEHAGQTAGGLACFAFSDGPVVPALWGASPRGVTAFHAPAMSPDGGRTAVVKRFGSDRPRQVIQLSNGGTGKILHEIPTDAADAVWQLAFAANGSLLLSLARSRKIHVWDADAGEPVGELVHPGRSYVSAFAVHPNGRVVAASRNDGTVWLWDVTARTVLRTLDWKLGKLLSVAFSPDGALAAAGTADGRIIVWDLDL